MAEFLLLPFVNGMLVAVLLALAGTALLLRGSVWQALAACQWAAVGGVAASTLGWLATPVAVAFAFVGMGLMRRADPARLPLGLFLAGSALIAILAANVAQASLAAARWIEGEILFAIGQDAAWSAGAVLLTLIMLPKLRGVWLAEQRGPDKGLAAGSPLFWRGFELVWLTLVLVLGARTLGVPAALAALLLPAWGAARLAGGYRSFVLWTQGIALGGMLLAWIPTIVWDQPFAPWLILIYAALAAAAAAVSYTRSD